MKPSTLYAAAYVQLVPKLAEVARRAGYAIGVHGSLSRDLDLIAAPWVDEALSAEELAELLRESVGGFIINDPTADPNDFVRRSPCPKPHGRLAWSIYLHGGPYIDLSVMPRSSTP